MTANEKKRDKLPAGLNVYCSWRNKTEVMYSLSSSHMVGKEAVSGGIKILLNSQPREEKLKENRKNVSNGLS